MRFLRRCLCVLRAGGGAGVRESVAHKWCTFGTHCGWRKDCVSPRVCTRIAPHGASTHWCRRTTQRRTQGTPKILLSTLRCFYYPTSYLEVCAVLGNSCGHRWSSVVFWVPQGSPPIMVGHRGGRGVDTPLEAVRGGVDTPSWLPSIFSKKTP